MKKCFFAIACMAIGLCSCQEDGQPDIVPDRPESNEPGTPGSSDPEISAPAKAALLKRYPQAADIRWTLKQGYAVAEFTLPDTRTTAVNRHAAWFDGRGEWHMTASGILSDMLPEPVRAAFAAGDYSAWPVGGIDRVLREGMETIYVIGTENTMDGVKAGMDLYYSADGVPVRKVADPADGYDYADYIPARPSDSVRRFIEGNYPRARIVEIDSEHGMTEVGILDSKTFRRLLFDTSGNWLYTKTGVRYGELPAAVRQAFDASAYARYRIDDIDHYDTPTGEYYRFELESAGEDVKVAVTPAGELTVIGQEPSPPGGGDGAGNGAMTAPAVRDFILQKYPGARILEYDYDDGMLEVEIHHDGREKEVRFNGAGAWVGTRWDIRRSELPEAVRAAVANSGYASYRMDDIEYVQTPSADYYLVELERGEREIRLRIGSDGTIL